MRGIGLMARNMVMELNFRKMVKDMKAIGVWVYRKAKVVLTMLMDRNNMRGNGNKEHNMELVYIFTRMDKKPTKVNSTSVNNMVKV